MSDDPFDEFLRGRAPRPPRRSPWLPGLEEGAEPLLLHDAESIANLAIATTVLEIIARRGGSRMAPSRLANLNEMFQGALPDFVAPHVREEVRQVLDWLEHPKEHPDDVWKDPATAAMELMDESDVEGRVRIARRALETEEDLEFEYVDLDRREWFRLRATPIEVREEDEQMVIAFQFGRQTLEIAAKHIRWLMPVRRSNSAPQEVVEPARVIRFPTWKITPEEE